MDLQGILAGVLVALHDATLDDALWPRTSALIDDACGTTGNALVVSERFGDDSRILFRACYYRGERNEELEQYYFRNYHHRDERVPRIRQLPDSLLVHVPDLYTEHEKKTSPAYNEALARTGDRHGLAVRLDSPDGTSISWIFADPSQPGVWGSEQLRMIQLLLPHIRGFVAVQQALAATDAINASLSGLLENTRTGVIQLDWRGRIVEANDVARAFLRGGDGLQDQGGFLRARLPADNARLQRLLAAALPTAAGRSVHGSMTVGRFSKQSRLVLHVAPVTPKQAEPGLRQVAAVVLLEEPGRHQPSLDSRAVAETLGLTVSESRVAAALAEGRNVREIARLMGREPATIRWILHHIYRKLGVHRQPELVHLVLSASDLAGHQR